MTAFASAGVSCARRVSQTRPGGRLDPPLTFVLDEAANVAPLPDMPAMMSDGGGRGMSTWAFVQSFAQLRARWGRDGADSIWGASSIKLLLGGCTEADDLERISRVVGDHRVRRRSHTSPGGLMARAHSSTATSLERERILPVEALARIRVGKALLLYRAVPAALIRLPAWWERGDAEVFKASRIGEVVRGSASLKTACGDIEIGIHAGTAARLDVHTSFGRVHNHMDTADSPESSDETIEVHAHTSYGDILIRRS